MSLLQYLFLPLLTTFLLTRNIDSDVTTTMATRNDFSHNIMKHPFTTKADSLLVSPWLPFRYPKWFLAYSIYKGHFSTQNASIPKTIRFGLHYYQQKTHGQMKSVTNCKNHHVARYVRIFGIRNKFAWLRADPFLSDNMDISIWKQNRK